MSILKLAMFGEAERGQYRKLHYCRSLEQLLDKLGNPPPESLGLHFAVQALLYERDLFFIRVEEEGFSAEEYLRGVRLLRNKDMLGSIHAICAPGVGDIEIISALAQACLQRRGMLVMSESDLYDFLTA